MSVGADAQRPATAADAPADATVDSEYTDSQPPARRRSWLVPVLSATVVVLLLVLPAVGLVATILFVLLLSPLNRFFEGRVAVVWVFAFFSSSVLFEVAKLPVSGATLRWLLIAVVAAVAIWSYLRHDALPLPRWSWASTIWLAAVSVLFASLYLPLWGATPAELLAALQIGWDHSSHFAFFAGSYEQQSVGFVTESGQWAFGSSYPAADVYLWSAVLGLVAGSAAFADTQELLGPYVVFSMATTALAVGILVAVVADMSRLLAGRGNRTVAAAAGALVAAILLVSGDAAQSWNFGHVNFLVIVTVAVAGSWYGFRLIQSGRLWFGAVTIAAAGVTALIMYPPVVVALAPVGLWMIWRVVGGRWLWWVVLGLLALGAGVVLLARFGTTPDGLLAAVDELAAAPGGPPPFDQLVLLALPVVAVLLARHAFVAAGFGASVAVTSAVVGLAGVAALLTWRALAQGFSLQPPDAYYAVKLWYGTALICISLLAVVAAVWFIGYRRYNAQPGRALTKYWSIAAWGVLIAVPIWAMGYFGPVPAGVSLGRVSPALEAFEQRAEAREAQAALGNQLIAASAVTVAGNGQPIFWETGAGADQVLRTNIWLMAISGGVSAADRALIEQIAPLSSESIAPLSEVLADNPDKTVQIAYVDPRATAYLEPLQQQFPEQVTLLPLF